MNIEKAKLPEYELLDSGDGYRLEKFGQYILQRPDPQVLWKKNNPSVWAKADAVFVKSGEEKGKWQLASDVPEKWLIHFDLPSKQRISFYAKLNPFKHTGIFPEQSSNWNFIANKIIESKKKIKVLNLFGYTGIPSVIAAKLGCEVTHVDASRPSIAAAKENMIASGLPEDSIRWILDDCLKFVKREAKRGNKYDAIIMDPPAFGRGAKGEVWKFHEDLPVLLDEVKKILSPDFSFVIINAYAVSVSAILLGNLLEDFGSKRKVEYGELVLEQKSGRLLSTGIFGRLF